MGLKVGVIGARGRMGSEVCRAVEADGRLELSARVDRDDSLDSLLRGNVEVAVDFTTPDAVKDNIHFCISNQIHAVVGTTGLSDEDIADIERWSATGSANVFVAPNFALGAVLMMTFAAQAAPYFQSAEIVERHHERKLDAPSGTSIRTASLMNEARSEAWAQHARAHAPEGSRGRDIGGVRVHSIRLPGSVAHQEVILGGQGETITIRHDSIDRSSFMPGVLLAVKSVPKLKGLTVGLEHLLRR